MTANFIEKLKKFIDTSILARLSTTSATDPPKRKENRSIVQ